MNKMNPDNIATGINAMKILSFCYLPHKNVSKTISGFVKMIKETKPMTVYVEAIASMPSWFPLHGIKEDPITFLIEAIKHSQFYENKALRDILFRLWKIGEYRVASYIITEPEILPRLYALAKETELEMAVLKFVNKFIDNFNREQI